MILQLRKDKYEKIYWYWVDVAYEGEQVQAESENLTRTTEISAGAAVNNIALGLSKGGQLPPATYSDDDDDVEMDLDSPSADEAGSGDDEEPDEPSKVKRKRRKNDLEEEIPEEAMHACMQHTP